MIIISYLVKHEIIVVIVNTVPNIGHSRVHKAAWLISSVVLKVRFKVR